MRGNAMFDHDYDTMMNNIGIPYQITMKHQINNHTKKIIAQSYYIWQALSSYRYTTHSKIQQLFH